MSWPIMSRLSRPIWVEESKVPKGEQKNLRRRCFMYMLDDILSHIRLEEITQHIRWMVENTPYRMADSADERRAAEYVTDQLSSYGLDAKILKFNTYNSFPQTSHMKILSPEPMVIDSLPCGHIVSTAPDGEELELVFVGNGGYPDYEGLNIAGKAVLVEVSYAPAVPEKARIAAEKGARAMVCMNWGSGQHVICHRALKAVWGNPTRETLSRIPQLIGVGVTQDDGRMLRDWCRSGQTVRIRLAAQSPTKWSQVCQPFGILRGNGKSDQMIVVGSHIDAWKPGVTCNATGNATTMQIAKVLSRFRDQLDRDVWFVFWNGHEIAEAAGSTWMVDNFWDELNKRCVAYFNIDSTGMGEATLYEIKTSAEYRDFTVANARSLLTEELRVQNLTKIGDQSFLGIGVPGTAQRMSYTKEYMEANCGATLGWWNHTSEDSFDKYSPENILKDTRVLTALIYRVSVAKVLPYDFTEKFQSVASKLHTCQESYGSYLDLDDIITNIQTVRTYIQKLQAVREEVSGHRAELLNTFLMQVARQTTNIFQTYADKYQQDSYGFSKLSKPIPLLADLELLPDLDPNSFTYGMIHTELVKNKNRINDGLHNLLILGRMCCELILGEVIEK